MTGQVHTQATPLGISSTPRGSRLGLILLLSLDLHRLGLILHAFQRLGLILHGRLGLVLHDFHGLHRPRALRRLVLSLGPLAPRHHRIPLHGVVRKVEIQVVGELVALGRFLGGCRSDVEPPFAD